MTPSVLLLSETIHLHLEGIRNQLLRRGGYRHVAVLALSEGREAFDRTLRTLLASSPRKLAVVTFDEDPARILEKFDSLFQEAQLPEAEVHHVFGLLDTPPFIRAMASIIRHQFDPNEPPQSPPIPEPEKIEEESFRIIDETISGFGFEAEWHQVVRRAVHAAADFEIADVMDHHPEAIDRGVRAIRSSAPILVDVQMVESGISRPLTEKFGNTLHCHVSDNDVIDQARKERVTRSTLAMRKAFPKMEGAIVVVGNAPTALFEVLRLVREEKARPALIVGVPVGFVGAAESKELLSKQDRIGWISTHGPKGGSTVAVAVMNALLRIADSQEKTGK
ncbi:MAG: precorrin-8X methylmutase [Leptospirales bacterium]